MTQSTTVLDLIFLQPLWTPNALTTVRKRHSIDPNMWLIRAAPSEPFFPPHLPVFYVRDERCLCMRVNIPDLEFSLASLALLSRRSLRPSPSRAMPACPRARRSKRSSSCKGNTGSRMWHLQASRGTQTRRAASRPAACSCERYRGRDSLCETMDYHSFCPKNRAARILRSHLGTAVVSLKHNTQTQAELCTAHRS